MSSSEKLLIYSLVDIHSFIDNQDFDKLYRGFTWGDDTWAKGFPNILRLELEISKTAYRGFLRRGQVLAVAAWSKTIDQGKIECPDTFTIPTSAQQDISGIIKRVKFHVAGLNPINTSKVVRFAFPYLAGAIDTGLVRVFGNGDLSSKRHSWLNLEVSNCSLGWYIPDAQSDWPADYLRWINILRVISSILNNNGVKCPHPTSFNELGLRSKGRWLCADVEMALFSYANAVLSPDKI